MCLFCWGGRSGSGKRLSYIDKWKLVLEIFTILRKFAELVEITSYESVMGRSKDEEGDEEKRLSKRLGGKGFAPFPNANVMWALQVGIADALSSGTPDCTQVLEFEFLPASCELDAQHVRTCRIFFV